MAMATLAFGPILPFNIPDPAGGLILFVAFYALLVLPVLSRLPEGMPDGTSLGIVPSFLRGLPAWIGVRIWILCAIVVTVLYAIYVYFLMDWFPPDFFPVILAVALPPLVIHGVIDLDELLFPKWLAPQIGKAPKRHSLLRRFAAPVVVSLLYSLLVVIWYPQLDWQHSGLIFLYVLPFFLPWAIYGLHVLFVYIQFRRSPPLTWPSMRRSIGHKFGIWIPTLMAAVTLLYFPQVYAVSGHLWHGTTETLPHYRVHIPWSWWVEHRSSDFGDNKYLGILTGKNIVQAGIKPYLSGQIIRSSVTFSIFDNGPDEGRLKQKAQQEGKGVASHDFEVGKLVLTCWEYAPGARWWGDRESQSRWAVDCSTMPTGGAPDLFVSFEGPKEDISAFYKALEGIERTD